MDCPFKFFLKKTLLAKILNNVQVDYTHKYVLFDGKEA